MHQGQCLHMQEKVRDLKQVVEVSMAQFHVNFYGQRISWTTRSETITYSQFISQLSFYGQLDIIELEKTAFSCIGCRRSITEDTQLLPIQSCRDRSLTLTATPQSNTRTLEDTQAVLIRFQRLLEQIFLENQTKLHKGAPKAVYKDFYETLEESELIYNANIEFVEKIKKHLVRIEDEIDKIQKENKTLKANNVVFERELNTLRSKTVASEKEAMTLKAQKTDLETNLQFFERVVRCLHENTGVKLFVFYDPDQFSPVITRSEIQQHGRYQFAKVNSHIKCVVPDLLPGWAAFEAVRDVLQPLFFDVIQEIGQGRSEVEGKDVAGVTCRADDEVPQYRNQSEFCDEDGKKVTWEEAEKRLEWQKIREGSSILISGGQRRTVLFIRHS